MKYILKKGFVGVVDRIDEGNPSAKRLVNMGLTHNTVLRITHIAPLGDPVVINVRNYSLAVRKKDLSAVVFKR